MSNNAPLEWTDPRPLSELAFGAAFFPEAERPPAKERAISLLHACGAGSVEDVAKLGCTGLAAHKLSLDDIVFLRRALGGTGVGLTCWVPPNRYCKAHETIGGLQERQVSRFNEAISAISRALTEDEQNRFGSIDFIRRMDPDAAHEILTNIKKADDDDDAEEAYEANKGELNEARTKAEVEAARAPFTCLDHYREPRWDCRYCAAEALVRGALDVKALLVSDKDVEDVAPTTVDDRIADLEKHGCDEVTLYVRVARWTRRLAREG